MPSPDLNAVETRVLGCLLEKERTTPENYPLSLHSLTSACNQSTNREPVVGYDEKTVENGVNSLREKKLATVVFGAGSRVQKYRHNLLDHYELAPREVALLCVLLLRGPQTPGELRSRTERMHAFNSLEAVEACLDELARGDFPLVRQVPARPGQKERRYLQLFSSETLYTDAPAEALFTANRASAPESSSPRIEAVEAELAALRQELASLREEFAAFRKQFE
jgi:uncharacterized protein YceH (UPF0502 family)